jgi:sodium/proline symporter
MLGLGWLAYKRTEKLADYILGGRRLGPWTTALSAGASDMSGWLLLGLPGLAFVKGWSSLFMAGGLLVGTAVNWYLISHRLRVFSLHFGDALTLPAFFEKRFGATSHGLRWVAALWILIFFTIYTSAGLVAGGKLFESVFAVPFERAVVLGGIAIVIYTFIGGFLAVSWTDLVQGLLMAGALIMLPAVVWFDEGLASTTSPDLFTESLGTIAVLNLVAWGLGYFGQPHILSRFKAIQDQRSLPFARRIALSWTGVSLLGAMAVGMAGSFYFNGSLDDPEKVFMELSTALLNPWVAGVLMAAVLAAIMSTADSQLLVCSSVLSEDFLRPLAPNLAERYLLMAGRLTVIIVALVAGYFALNPDSRVLDLVAYAWSGFGAAFGPAVILSLYHPRYSKAACLTSLILGGATVLIWKQLDGGLFDLYEIVPGFLLALFGGWAATIMFPADNETEQAFRAARRHL